MRGRARLEPPKKALLWINTWRRFAFFSCAWKEIEGQQEALPPACQSANGATAAKQAFCRSFRIDNVPAQLAREVVDPEGLR